MEEGKVISALNEKGGVGKTATNINLGVALANEGKKVLLVDMDSSGNLTTHLGFKGAQRTVADLMQDVMFNRPVDTASAILHHKEHVDLLPADRKLADVEVMLTAMNSRETVLKHVLKDVKKDYDYILIDSKPSLGLLTINCLAAADSAIIPTLPSFLSVDGLTQLVSTIGTMRNGTPVSNPINSKLKIDGVLCTIVDNRNNNTKKNREILRNEYGKILPIYDTEIPICVKVAEASGSGESIFCYDPKATAAKAYANLAKEVLTRDEKQRAKQQPSLSR